ncbi:MAG: DUF1330 domain-containing protein [Syntrophales bacterium]|nr:DUF1330 domain-containing protein [Syntrophales bacterium]
MAAVKINEDEWRKLSDSKDDKPFIMLNLLKFQGDEGRASYFRYMREAGRFVARYGAEVIFLGQPRELITGNETWDLVMLVKYPSRKAFLKMAYDPEYVKVHKYREEGLERAVLYAMDEVTMRDLLNVRG